MANKSIIDVNTAESITQEDLFYVNSNKSLKQIKNKNLKFDYDTNVINKPSINGVELCGGDGKSLNELGIGSSADITVLRQAKAGAIISSAKGERIAVGDSAGAFFEGLKLHGKSEQNGSPTPDNPIPIKSCGDGGAIGIRVLRKNLCKVTSVLNASFDENTGTLVNNAKNNTVKSYVKIQKYKGDKFLEEIPVSNTGKTEKIFSINGTFNRIRLAFAGDRSEGSISIDVSYLNYGEYTLSMDIEEIGMNEGRISKIMLLNEGESDEIFEPFQHQQASLSTPNGLPGIKVDSGGNYTDSNGQQWICDEMDFKRGKYVQRVKKMVLNDTGWCLTTKDKYQAFGLTVDNNKGNIAGMCDKFTHIDIVSSSIGFNTKTKGRIYLTTGHETLEELKAWIKENPVTVVYALATSIETDIPEETMTAYRKLYTNYPSTVVQNDSGAGMEVEYVADTKSYIDNKLKELVQAAYGSMANMLSLMPTNVQAEMIENETNNILNNL